MSWINIVNFKCFQGFEAKNFGRVNLIGGKNNVGKTAFLEACYIDTEAANLKSFVSALRGIKFMRENLNILAEDTINDIRGFVELSKGLNIASSRNSSCFEIDEANGEKNYIFRFNNQEIKTNSNNFSFAFEPIQNIKFIDSFGYANSEIIENYASVQKKEGEDFLNAALNKFDNSIESFKVFNNAPQCKTGGQWLEITELGDGVRHIVSIVTALFQCEDGYLFIDELENGIHYSYLDSVWETILKLSKELNIQVFATTHSKECVEAYMRAAKKLEDKDITFIRLSRLQDGQIKASTLDYELLENSIEQDHEVRGW